MKPARGNDQRPLGERLTHLDQIIQFRFAILAGNNPEALLKRLAGEPLRAKPVAAVGNGAKRIVELLEVKTRFAL